MATTTAQASGVTSPDNWTLVLGASKAAAVTAPDDDSTTYISSGTSINTTQTFTVSPSLSVGDTITQIDINARAQRPGLNANFVTGYSFTPDGGGSQTGESGAFTSTGTWTTYTYTHSSLSVVWGSGMTIYARNTQNREVHISTLEIVITYTPAAGGGQPKRTMHIVRLMGGG